MVKKCEHCVIMPDRSVRCDYCGTDAVKCGAPITVGNRTIFCQLPERHLQEHDWVAILMA